MLPIMTQHLTILQRLALLSTWIDEKFFPLPATPAPAKTHTIEQAHNYLRRQIRSCHTLKYSYILLNQINNLKAIYGTSQQVMAISESLHLALYNKQRDILWPYKR